MNIWCNDMSLAPFDNIDIVDSYGDRFVNCYKRGSTWYGVDVGVYEPSQDEIYTPTHWMKVEMPK